MTGRRRRRSKQLLDDIKERVGYWNSKDEAINLTLWRTRFGRGCGKVDCELHDSVCYVTNMARSPDIFYFVEGTKYRDDEY